MICWHYTTDTEHPPCSFDCLITMMDTNYGTRLISQKQRIDLFVACVLFLFCKKILDRTGENYENRVFWLLSQQKVSRYTQM